MKKFVLGTFAFAVCLGAYAQNASIPVAYVSGLRAEVEGSAVKLLWSDADVKGARYVIYRYTEELNENNWQQAQKLAVVPSGQQSYIDHPSDTKPHYYAVLVEAPSGKPNPLFIPFRNVTTRGVAIRTSAGGGPEYADVTSISATLSGRSIDLSFKSSQSDRELVVYRSTSPIVTESDLLEALSVGVIPSSQTSFEDTPVAGIPYYYAVVDSATLASGKVDLIQGQNSTSRGIEVPIQTNAAGQIEYATKRPRPLPFLTLTNNLQSGAPLPSAAAQVVPERKPLTKPTSAAVGALLGSLPSEKAPSMHPTLLDPEKGVVTGGGEEYTLKSIVDGPFAAGDWKKTQTALEGFLNIRRSKGIENRARFYLGQAYYFEGEYRKSFLQFLVVENALYTDVQPWLDALFSELRTSETKHP